MSYPQTDDVIAALQTGAANAVQLLRQYRQLCVSLEAGATRVQALEGDVALLLDRLRLKDAEIEQLRAELTGRDATIRTMEDHPDVKAARLARLKDQKAIVEAAIKQLEPPP